MTGYSGMVIYWWFFPLILQIALPLLALAFFLSARLSGLKMARISCSTKSDCIEKRLSSRINFDDSTVDISHTFGTVSGKVSNVSLLGICIKELPQESLRIPKKLFLRIKGENGSFSMLGKTRWQHTRQSGRSLGVKIESAPPGWRDFVRKAHQAS